MVAVRHDGATIIPRGHTRLITGDRVTVIAGSTAVDEIQSMFRAIGADESSSRRWRLDRRVASRYPTASGSFVRPRSSSVPPRSAAPSPRPIEA